jgi:hypothetical protein
MPHALETKTDPFGIRSGLQGEVLFQAITAPVKQQIDAWIDVSITDFCVVRR